MWPREPTERRFNSMFRNAKSSWSHLHCDTALAKFPSCQFSPPNNYMQRLCTTCDDVSTHRLELHRTWRPLFSCSVWVCWLWIPTALPRVRNSGPRPITTWAPRYLGRGVEADADTASTRLTVHSCRITKASGSSSVQNKSVNNDHKRQPRPNPVEFVSKFKWSK